MACTTLLVGKNATYDGSCMIARNEDCGGGQINEKSFDVVTPDKQPRHYKADTSHVEIDLPEEPMRYTHTPDAVNHWGIFSEAGVNEAHVAMTATETTTSNERVLGADPYVELIEAKGKPGDSDYVPEVAGGIGEEDFVTLVLPYIKTPREGVLRLGSLLEKYGTYESNGLAFANTDEIWWMETIGGHHWIARRVPDDSYVVMPNQFGLDNFDFEDAFGEQKECLCSADLYEFIVENHLNLNMGDEPINPRDCFGSHTDADHVYNTPRAWAMLRYFNPHLTDWDSSDSVFTPESDDMPWSCVPEKKICVEDIKYVMGLHYQGTPYDPYGKHEAAGKYRSIGINRNCEMSLMQMRGYAQKQSCAIQWLSLGCNMYNCMVPLYTNINSAPEYVANTTAQVTTESMYWTNRIIAALADPYFGTTANIVEAYQLKMGAYGQKRVHEIDQLVQGLEGDELTQALETENEKTCAYVREQTDALLGKILFIAYDSMKNCYNRNDN